MARMSEAIAGNPSTVHDNYASLQVKGWKILRRQRSLLHVGVHDQAVPLVDKDDGNKPERACRQLIPDFPKTVRLRSYRLSVRKIDIWEVFGDEILRHFWKVAGVTLGLRPGWAHRQLEDRNKSFEDTHS
jgi:hypothetical protein